MAVAAKEALITTLVINTQGENNVTVVCHNVRQILRNVISTARTGTTVINAVTEM